jgi:hypothetical protein
VLVENIYCKCASPLASLRDFSRVFNARANSLLDPYLGIPIITARPYKGTDFAGFGLTWVRSSHETIQEKVDDDA